ncbi:PadR family transcriptional regulator [Nonomuraea sp. NPDC059194]|uniref:PadR family transcriptional regulator n=1 Tax=Nonomuraea sp. NPDC059194 TaxID=3346764 RepID=UPI0036CEB328
MNKLACIILGRLVTQPMAGYDLYKWLSKEAPYFGYTPQPSQIYRQLNECLAKGWVEATLDVRDAGPDAKVYRLTDEGVAAFRAWAESAYTPTERPLEADFQMRMLLAGVLGPETALEILRTELEFRREQQVDSRPYDVGADVTDAAVPIDVAWQQELVRLVGERSYLLGQTNLAWLEMASARLGALIDARRGSDTASPDLEA